MTTDDAVTAEAVDSLRGTDDPRLRELLTTLVRHLHAFTRETDDALTVLRAAYEGGAPAGA